MSEMPKGAGGNDNNDNNDNNNGNIGEARGRRPVKRSVRIAGHSTSVSLEDEFWQALRGIARKRGQSLSALLTEVDRGRQGRSLASACRIYVLQYFQERTADGA